MFHGPNHSQSFAWVMSVTAGYILTRDGQRSDEMRENCDSKRSILPAQTAEIKKKRKQPNKRKFKAAISRGVINPYPANVENMVSV